MSDTEDAPRPRRTHARMVIALIAVVALVVAVIAAIQDPPEKKTPCQAATEIGRDISASDPSVISYLETHSSEAAFSLMLVNLADGGYEDVDGYKDVDGRPSPELSEHLVTVAGDLPTYDVTVEETRRHISDMIAFCAGRSR